MNQQRLSQLYLTFWGRLRSEVERNQWQLRKSVVSNLQECGVRTL